MIYHKRAYLPPTHPRLVKWIIPKLPSVSDQIRFAKECIMRYFWDFGLAYTEVVQICTIARGIDFFPHHKDRVKWKLW